MICNRKLDRKLLDIWNLKGLPLFSSHNVSDILKINSFPRWWTLSPAEWFFKVLHPRFWLYFSWNGVRMYDVVKMSHCFENKFWNVTVVLTLGSFIYINLHSNNILDATHLRMQWEKVHDIYRFRVYRYGLKSFYHVLCILIIYFQFLNM